MIFIKAFTFFSKCAIGLNIHQLKARNACKLSVLCTYFLAPRTFISLPATYSMNVSGIWSVSYSAAINERSHSMHRGWAPNSALWIIVEDHTKNEISFTDSLCSPWTKLGCCLPLTSSRIGESGEAQTWDHQNKQQLKRTNK